MIAWVKQMEKMTRTIKPQFDPDQNFVIVRPLKANGVIHGPGQPFDKASVPVRRLRQLYDGNWIKMCGPGADVYKMPERPRPSAHLTPEQALAMQGGAGAKTDWHFDKFGRIIEGSELAPAVDLTAPAREPDQGEEWHFDNAGRIIPGPAPEVAPRQTRSHVRPPRVKLSKQR